MATTESGHHESRVYQAQSGDIICSSGAAIKIEPKGVFSVASSGEFRNKDLITHTTANMTLESHGISILRNVAKCVFTMRAPVAGAQKMLIFKSTASAMVRLSTGAVNAYPVRLAGGAKSSACVIKCSSAAMTMSAPFGTARVDLIATAATAWQNIGTMKLSTQAIATSFTFSSST